MVVGHCRAQNGVQRGFTWFPGEVPISLELVWASEPWPEAASRYISLKTA